MGWRWNKPRAEFNVLIWSYRVMGGFSVMVDLVGMVNNESPCNGSEWSLRGCFVWTMD